MGTQSVGLVARNFTRLRLSLENGEACEDVLKWLGADTPPLPLNAIRGGPCDDSS